jgi:hypothetical protein
MAWTTFDKLPWQSKTNIYVGAIMTGIATFAVALRFISKASIGSKIRSDDWWILCACFFICAALGILTCGWFPSRPYQKHTNCSTGALRGFEDAFFLGQVRVTFRDIRVSSTDIVSSGFDHRVSLVSRYHNCY